MWVKKLDADELGIEFMPRSMDPLDKRPNKYDNMVEDEEEFDETQIEIGSNAIMGMIGLRFPEATNDHADQKKYEELISEE